MIDFGVPTGEERQELARVLEHAFAASAPNTVETWYQSAGYPNLRVLRGDDGVRGGLILVPMGQFFGGRSVPMTGLAGVAIRSDLLRRGLARAMLKATLEELAESGAALATLYASTASLYRSLGFEAAGCRFLSSFSPTELRLRDHGLPLRQATAADHRTAELLYRQLAPSQAGALDRGLYIWERLYDERFGVPARGVVVEEDGAVAGYLFYRQHLNLGDRYRLEITDIAASSAAALRRLWTYLSDLGTMVAQVDLFTAPQDASYLVHEDPRFRMSLQESWLVRIVDLRQALEARGYPRALSGSLSLEVDDQLLPENAGRWRLVIDGGHAVVSRGGDGELRADPRGLAALYTGFAAPEALALCGRLSGSAEALRRAGALFAGPLPWMREQF